MGINKFDPFFLVIFFSGEMRNEAKETLGVIGVHKPKTTFEKSFTNDS